MSRPASSRFLGTTPWQANDGNTSPPQCGGMPSTFSRRRHADERIAATHRAAASFFPRQKTKRTGLPNKARRVGVYPPRRAPAAIAALPPHPPLSHGGEREYWVPSPLSRRAPGRGTAPLAGVRLRPWPAAVARGRAANHDDVRFCRSFPRSFAVPQSVPSSAVSALKAVPGWPATLKAGQIPCQRRGKKVINIKVCKWHGWKKCEIGHKNR